MFGTLRASGSTLWLTETHFPHTPYAIPCWRHQMETFSALLVTCAGNSPVNSPHKSQCHGALMFSLICTRINGWVNNREPGDLSDHGTHYDVIVMQCSKLVSLLINLVFAYGRKYECVSSLSYCLLLVIGGTLFSGFLSFIVKHCSNYNDRVPADFI